MDIVLLAGRGRGGSNMSDGENGGDVLAAEREKCHRYLLHPCVNHKELYSLAWLTRVLGSSFTSWTRVNSTSRNEARSCTQSFVLVPKPTYRM